jgi:NitT/TauT family transport system permease protein
MVWSERFKVEMVENDFPPTSWFYDLLHNSRFSEWFFTKIFDPLMERIDLWMSMIFTNGKEERKERSRLSWIEMFFIIIVAAGVIYGFSQALFMLFSLRLDEWLQVGAGIIATLIRVIISLVLALAWTIPLCVAIGTNPRLSAVLQPIVQVIASVPATAVFPVFILLLVNLPGGLNLAAVLLMLMGTQWYLLFNIIAGASAIPQDLKYTATLIHLSRWEKWRTLILPALFPYLITGMITASGGAWNASIVSEYVNFGGQTLKTIGIGSLISQATADGHYHLLLAGTLSMVLTVIVINRVFWRRLYVVAEEKYRME